MGRKVEKNTTLKKLISLLFQKEFPPVDGCDCNICWSCRHPDNTVNEGEYD